MFVAGAAAGVFSTPDIFIDVTKKTEIIIALLGLKKSKSTAPSVENSFNAQVESNALWYVSNGNKRAWVDLQNDVTVKDIQLSHQEGFVSVEHLKRYTTLGMATDQGKNSNVTGLAIMAEITGNFLENVEQQFFDLLIFLSRLEHWLADPEIRILDQLG